MHNQMLAVHSDRRLFIGHLGNACICSVKLDYHQSESVSLEAEPYDRAWRGAPRRCTLPSAGQSTTWPPSISHFFASVSNGSPPSRRP
jgi:hypothetical protein